MAHDLLVHRLVRYYGRIAILGACLASTGCLIDTVPLPEDQKTTPETGTANGWGLGINVSAIYYTEQPTFLVGTEGAVRSRAEVWVTDLNSAFNWQTATHAAANGSFNLPLNAQTGDELEISMVVSGVELDSTTLQLTPPSSDAYRANSDLSNYAAPPNGSGSDGHGECANGICGTPGVTLVVTAPDSLGLVTVSGPPGAVAETITVVVADLTGGASTAATRFPDGSFNARLPGNSGDQLALFAVDSASSNAGSTPTTLFVP